MTTAIRKQIDYWNDSAMRNWRTAQSLFKLKHYDACLFFCHLTLEKTIKAFVMIRTQKPASYIHDLSYLAKQAGLKPTPVQQEQFRLITTFNIAGRYGDTKYQFYKQCTRLYTKKYLDITKQLRLWLEEQFPKK